MHVKTNALDLFRMITTQVLELQHQQNQIKIFNYRINTWINHKRQQYLVLRLCGNRAYLSSIWGLHMLLLYSEPRIANSKSNRNNCTLHRCKMVGLEQFDANYKMKFE